MQTLSPAEIESRSLALLDSFSVLHFTAPNDRNGNPRRLWAVFTPAGQLVAAYDEGYEGSQAVPVAIRHKAATCYAVPVAASTDSAMLRHARQLMAGPNRPPSCGLFFIPNRNPHNGQAFRLALSSDTRQQQR